MLSGFVAHFVHVVGLWLSVTLDAACVIAVAYQPCLFQNCCRKNDMPVTLYVMSAKELVGTAMNTLLVASYCNVYWKADLLYICNSCTRRISSTSDPAVGATKQPAQQGTAISDMLYENRLQLGVCLLVSEPTKRKLFGFS